MTTMIYSDNQEHKEQVKELHKLLKDKWGYSEEEIETNLIIRVWENGKVLVQLRNIFWARKWISLYYCLLWFGSMGNIDEGSISIYER